jgi:hypothetical protein
LDIWNPAKVWVGSNSQKCGGCGGFISRGEWSKVHRLTGNVWHDDCAEDAGAYNGLAS